MSKYTVELRYLLETQYPFKWVTAYPIFDEKFRDTLNAYIKNHFMFREIGFETPAMFDHYIGMTLSEIMPYYNELFKTTLLEINPLVNFTFEETMAKNETGNTNSSSSGTGSSKYKDVESRPADGLVSMDDIENNIYANRASLGTTSNETGGTSESLNKVATDYVKKMTGLSGVSQSELLMQYRKTIISTVSKLLHDDELNQCFMGVY